jgi:hypothetical protein
MFKLIKAIFSLLLWLGTWLVMMLIALIFGGRA